MVLQEQRRFVVAEVAGWLQQIWKTWDASLSPEVLCGSELCRGLMGLVLGRPLLPKVPEAFRRWLWASVLVAVELLLPKRVREKRFRMASVDHHCRHHVVHATLPKNLLMPQMEPC